MNRKDEIRSAYKSLGRAHSFYDGMMLGTSFTGKLIDRVVWNMSGEEVTESHALSLSALPADFSGRLLEVPVGTGVLSMPVFRNMKNADITCLDYSEQMMESARKRAEEMHIPNIHFVQGDVGKLPFEDESFDAVLSLNGFHAFPDKEAAWMETYRVLKPGGIFTGCFYAEGLTKRTDLLIRTFYVRSGFFTPPFETPESLERRLKNMYSEVSVSHVQSIAVFQGRK